MVAGLCEKYSITSTCSSTTCQIEAIQSNQLEFLRDRLWWLSEVPITIPTVHTALARSGSSISKSSWNLWHCWLAHLNLQSMKMVLVNSLLMAIEVEEYDLVACTIFSQANQHSKIICHPVARTTCSFKIIHSHLGRSIAPTSFSGLPSFIIYIDNHTRYTSDYFLSTKEATHITGCFQIFITRIEKCFAEYSVTRFQCHNCHGEYSNMFFHRTLKASGVLFKPTPPYTPHKNGLSEQMIRIIATKERRLSLDLKIGSELWAEPINTATYLHAGSTSRVLGNKSPYAVLYCDKQSLLYISHFSYLAFKLVPEAQRGKRKFGSKSKKYAMLVYVHNTSKIWKL